jgi:hypothetical protein
VKNIKKITIFLFLGLFFIQPAKIYSWQNPWNNHHQHHRYGQIDFREFCIDFLKLYLKDFVAMTAHELGHAIASNIFSDSSIDINVGVSRMDDGAKLFEIPQKPSSLSINSIFPTGGFANVNFSQNSTLKNVAICLAGPICGALTYYFFNIYATYQLYKKHKIKWTLKKLLKESAYSTDAVAHLLSSLFPLGTNDGADSLIKLFPKSESEILDITCNDYYKASIGVLIDFIFTENARAIHNKLNCTALASRTGAYKKHFYETIIRQGNRYLMLLAHKALIAAKHGKNTMFEPNDAAKITFMLLYQQYFRAVKIVYSK